MVSTSKGKILAEKDSQYDRESELKLFDDSKTGVKGLVDSGIVKLPRIFIDEQHKLDHESGSGDCHKLSIPIIDFRCIEEDASARCETIEKIGNACQKWGFFQVVSHGIPEATLVEMIDAVRRFHELDSDLKKEFYSRDPTRSVVYNTNFNFHQSAAANWRDSLFCLIIPRPPNSEELPEVCRDIMVEYSNEIMKIGLTVFELLSEALGLSSNHLEGLGCAAGLNVIGHYYPACPEPELTLGLSKHTDSTFLTVVLQDQMGGLQVLHEDQWVDVDPLPGALIFNIGDLTQIISNDRFKSVYHRVLAKNVGPRISLACVFRMDFQQGNNSRLYGPIKELLSKDNPPIYREITADDFATYLDLKGPLDGIYGPEYFKL